MYNILYNEFVNAGITTYCVKYVFMEKEENKVDESERFDLIQSKTVDSVAVAAQVHQSSSLDQGC